MVSHRERIYLCISPHSDLYFILFSHAVSWHKFQLWASVNVDDAMKWQRHWEQNAMPHAVDGLRPRFLRLASPADAQWSHHGPDVNPGVRRHLYRTASADHP